MRTDYSEERLRELFAQVPVPPGVGHWRTVAPTGPRRWPAAVAAALTVAAIAIAVHVWPAGDPPAPNPPAAPTTAVTPTLEPWPTAETTGIPAGTQLTTHDGDLHITTAGAVVSDVYVRGSVFVEAANVTLRRVKIVPGAGADLALHQFPGAPDLRLEDCEIAADGTHQLRFALLQEARGLFVRGCHFSGVVIALTVMQGAVVTDNLIDALVSSPYTIGVVTHGVADGPIELRHNRIVLDSDAGSAIGLLTTYGASRGITVERNLLTGGAWCLDGGGSAQGTHDIRVIGNRFSRVKFPTGGAQGAAIHFDATKPGAEWRDNVWYEDGTAVRPA